MISFDITSRKALISKEIKSEKIFRFCRGGAATRKHLLRIQLSSDIIIDSGEFIVAIDYEARRRFKVALNLVAPAQRFSPGVIGNAMNARLEQLSPGKKVEPRRITFWRTKFPRVSRPDNTRVPTDPDEARALVLAISDLGGFDAPGIQDQRQALISDLLMGVPAPDPTQFAPVVGVLGARRLGQAEMPGGQYISELLNQIQSGRVLDYTESPPQWKTSKPLVLLVHSATRLIVETDTHLAINVLKCVRHDVKVIYMIGRGFESDDEGDTLDPLRKNFEYVSGIMPEPPSADQLKKNLLALKVERANSIGAMLTRVIIVACCSSSDIPTRQAWDWLKSLYPIQVHVGVDKQLRVSTHDEVKWLELTDVQNFPTKLHRYLKIVKEERATSGESDGPMPLLQSTTKSRA